MIRQQDIAYILMIQAEYLSPLKAVEMIFKSVKM